ncbi:hypothetical protein GCM10010191_35270 [Actinomadura vinacea]|uniref:Sensor domain-containing protein n=1 Tax=Actinomadura vinacea TaxID=115336 RepID=A0ABP5W675_9ACTN
MTFTLRGTTRVTATPAILVSAALCLSACSDEGQSAPPPPKPSSSTAASPPPSYSPEKIKAASLTPKEVGKDIRETQAAVEALKDRQAPMCSLSGVELKGDPEIGVRQYANSAQGSDEIRYAQLIARYDDGGAANESFQALRSSARGCPPRRNVPAKKIRKNFTLFAHDDTWKVTEDTVAGWRRLRGTEQQTYPASASKFNVLHFMYDYAVRGNLVIATVYWERTEPKKPADPIGRRATELLTKQLQKFG